MKRIFYTTIAAGMLFVSSCSQEEGMDVTHGENQMVTFEVEIPIAESRADIGTGTHANHLLYAVYETGSTEAEPLITDIIPNGRDANGKFSVTIPMARNVKYDLLFLAYNEDHCAFDMSDGEATNLKKLEFKNVQTPNDDAFDAFVGSLKAQGVADDNHVTLTRPFAQVNAATTKEDLDAVAGLQTTVTKSSLVINGVPQYYDVLEKKAFGGPISVTYGATDIMVNADNTYKTLAVNGTDYYRLALAYVLAGEVSTTSTHTAVFQFMQAGDDKVVRELEIYSLPIQRNYCTHVVGTLLTKSQEYTITIELEQDDDNQEVDREGNLTGTGNSTSD